MLKILRSLFDYICHKPSPRIEAYGYFSPRKEGFYHMVEEGIQGVVKELIKKRYLTFSSCEGHDIYGRRFVAFATPGVAEAHEFIYQFNQWALITYPSGYLKAKMRLLRDYEDYDEDGNLIEFDSNRHLQMVNYYNRNFGRGYMDYAMVEITIGPVNPPRFSLVFFKRALWKMAYREEATNDVINYIKIMAKTYGY